jgi:hypothetical protein
VHEYILHYAKNKNDLFIQPVYTLEKDSGGNKIRTSSILKAKENGIFSTD